MTKLVSTWLALVGTLAISCTFADEPRRADDTSSSIVSAPAETAAPARSNSLPSNQQLELRPGQSAITNDLVVQCLGDRVQVMPSNVVDRSSSNLPDSGIRPSVHASRGPLQSSYGDCRLSNGTTVRVKSGQLSEPKGYGECGGAPGEKLSVWIDHRKVLSSFGYSSFCEDTMIKSLVIRPASATACLPPVNDQSFHVDGFGDLRAHGLDENGCAELPLAHPPEIDAREFPGHGIEPSEVGALTLEASPARRVMCRQLLPAKLGDDPTVPDSLPHPEWQEMKVELEQPDLAHVGFNATTLSSSGTVDSATFDLENTGKQHRIYMHDSLNHWFDGTALAVDAMGLLTTPFDAHDSAASLRRGIHVWVYEHAQVFLHTGQTYILLDPVNHEDDPRVVTLHGGRESTVCTFHRTRENF